MPRLTMTDWPCVSVYTCQNAVLETLHLFDTHPYV